MDDECNEYTSSEEQVRYASSMLAQALIIMIQEL